MLSDLRRQSRYLFSQPAFRENPLPVLTRARVWMFYCAIRYAPHFRVTEGVFFKVDPALRKSGSSSAFILREWAEPELRHLDQFLPRDGTFIDCGANIGIYTARASDIVGPGGSVVAVEPGSISFQRLQRNIGLNSLPQVCLVNKAVSDTIGVARFYHDDGPVAYSLVAIAGADFESVSTTTIDELAAERRLSRVDCIKLDVEGVEALVLRGAQSVLDRFKPIIIFERTSPGQKRRDITEDLSEVLKSLGYRIYIYAGDSRATRGYRSPNLVAIHPKAGREVPSCLIPWVPPNAE